MGLGIEVVDPKTFSAQNILAFSTTQAGGFSSGVYSSLNLAQHLDDSPFNVEKNRSLLADYLSAQAVSNNRLKDQSLEPIFWLNQQHTNKAVYADGFTDYPPTADAVWTDKVNQPIAVLTADCLPILLASKSGRLVAAIHAGWRGLSQGIVENTLQDLPEKLQNLEAWIGPAISQDYFQVGVEVKAEFIKKNPQWDRFFKPDISAGLAQKYLADLAGIAEDILLSLRVGVVQSNLCTFADKRFYSYRKSGETGRIASIIMLQQEFLSRI